MKYTFYFLTFLIFSILCVFAFKGIESARLSLKNKVYVDTVNVFSQMTQNEIITLLEDIAQEEGVNIYRTIYDNSGSTEIRTIYYSIGDEDLFHKNYLYELNGENSFDPNMLVILKPIKVAENEDLSTRLRIESKDSSSISNALKRIGVNSDSNILRSSKFLYLQSIVGYLLHARMQIFLYIILILSCFVTLDKIVMDSRATAVKKLHGQGIGNILFQQLKETALCLLVSVFAVSIIQVIYLWLYNGLSRYFEFSSFYALACLIFSLFLIIITILFSFIYNYAFLRIQYALKYKRPVKAVQAINVVFFFITSIVSIGLFINTWNSHIEVTKLDINTKEWNILKDYCNLSFSYTDIGEGIEKDKLYYQMGINCQKLYGLINKRGGIVVDPSYAFLSNYALDHPLSSNNFFSPDDGNVIFANANYLNLQKVYDEKGRLIDFQDNNDNLVLVPEKYKPYESNIKKIFVDYYGFRKNIANEVYLQALGYALPKTESATVSIQYISNNQSFFLYSTNLGVDNNNCATEPIIGIITNDNYGGDGYLKILSSFYCKAFTGSKTYTVSNLQKDIESSSLARVVRPISSYEESIGMYLISLKQSLKLSFFMLMLIVTIDFLLLSFFVTIYLENNKYENYIKTLYGKSFLGIYYIPFLTVIFVWVGENIWLLVSGQTAYGTFANILTILELFFVYCLISLVQSRYTSAIVKRR